MIDDPERTFREAQAEFDRAFKALRDASVEEKMGAFVAMRAADERLRAAGRALREARQRARAARMADA